MIRFREKNGVWPIGNPQSRGIPTWFILPDPIAEAYLSILLKEENGLSNLKIDKIKEFLKMEKK